MQSRSNQLIAAIVAASIVITAIFEGGYSIEARAVLAILVWATLIAGLGFGYLPRSRLPDAALVAASLLGAVAVLAGLSIAWANDDGTVVNEFIRASLYLGVFLLVVCISREGEMRAWLLGLALGIVAVGVIALLSRLIPALPGGDEQISRLLPFARGRLSFPIGYWNGLAALLALGVVLLVWQAGFARRLAGRAAATSAIPVLVLTIYLTSSRGGFSALTVGLVALIAMGPRRDMMIGSATLGAVAGGLLVALASQQADLLDAQTGRTATVQGVVLLVATIACTLFVWLARVRLEQPFARLELPRGRMRSAIIVVVLIAAALIANPAQRFGDFKEVPGAESSDPGFVASHLVSGSGSGRWQFWGEALDAFGSEPLYGVGAGGYANYWNQHAPIDIPLDLRVKDAHSLYLEQLAELGLLAPLALIGFLLIGPVRALRERQLFVEGDEVAAAVGLVGTGALSAAIDWTWELPVVFGPVVIAAALLCGSTLVVKAQAQFAGAAGSPRGAAPWRGPFSWWVGAIVVGLVTFLLAWSSLLAERSLVASQDAANNGEFKQAADDARDAIALQPWASEPRLQLGLVQGYAGDYDAADDSLREAIERAPNDWQLWLAQASIAIAADRIPDAAAAYQRAYTLNPRAPIFPQLRKPVPQSADGP